MALQKKSAAELQADAFKQQVKLPHTQKLKESAAHEKQPTLSKAQSKYNDKQKFEGLMRPRGDALKHPAGPTLLEYATKGCPVDCGPDWSREQIEKAIKEGPSKSAQQPEAAKACREEAV